LLSEELTPLWVIVAASPHHFIAGTPASAPSSRNEEPVKNEIAGGKGSQEHSTGESKIPMCVSPR
jgi:hypothetical protein